MEFKPFQVYSLLSVRSLYTVHHMNFSSGFSFAGERHDFWEFNYILDGSAGATSNDNVYICHAGDAFLHAPNQYHTLWVNEHDACEIFTITFDGTGLEHKLSPGQYQLTEEEKHHVEGILSKLDRLFENYNTIDFVQLAGTSSPNNAGYQMIKNYLELLCLSLIQRGHDLHGTPLSDADSLCYAKITSFLRDNIEEKLTLDDICRGVYESPAKVKEVFRRFTNGGVMHYFHQMRCEHIMRLISEGHSIKSIAETMHFSSPYYLSYFFKRETGIPPAEYKKRQRR